MELRKKSIRFFTRNDTVRDHTHFYQSYDSQYIMEATNYLILFEILRME